VGWLLPVEPHPLEAANFRQWKGQLWETRGGLRNQVNLQVVAGPGNHARRGDSGR
jgi:hypothetical protein